MLHLFRTVIGEEVYRDWVDRSVESRPERALAHLNSQRIRDWLVCMFPWDDPLFWLNLEDRWRAFLRVQSSIEELQRTWRELCLTEVTDGTNTLGFGQLVMEVQEGAARWIVV